MVHFTLRSRVPRHLSIYFRASTWNQSECLNFFNLNLEDLVKQMDYIVIYPVNVTWYHIVLPLVHVKNPIPQCLRYFYSCIPIRRHLVPVSEQRWRFVLFWLCHFAGDLCCFCWAGLQSFRFFTTEYDKCRSSGWDTRFHWNKGSVSRALDLMCCV